MKIKSFFSILVILVLSLLAIPNWAQQKDQGVKAGYMGDPAAKRGMLLGYDMGRRDGKADKDAGKTNSLKNSAPYTNPEKFYRHEYGSMAAFVAAFKKGYGSGYESAYSGKKVDISKQSDKNNTEQMIGIKTQKSSVSVSSDAL